MKKLTRKIKLSWAFLSLSLFITSCTPTSLLGTPTVDIECNLPEKLKEKPTAVTEKPAEKINLEIKVDATPSMAGFVNNPRQSRYEQTLDLIDVVASASWSRDRSTIKYYRFGTRQEEISKSTYIDAKTPGFYQGGGDFNDSQVKVAISPPTPGKMSLIVTDLYQTDTDISSVIKQLKNYLQKDYAIGILGIRSEFEGLVYDIGVRKDERPYSTAGKKPEQWRPFYLIILGKYADISYFFEQLKEKNPELVGDNFIVFYPNIISKTALFDLENYPPKFPRSKNINDVSNLNTGTIKAKINQKSLTPGILLTADTEESIQFTIPYYSPNYVLPIDTDKADAFQAKIEVLVPNKTKDKLEPSTANEQALAFSNWQITSPNSQGEGQLTFTTSLNSEALKSGIYQMNAELIPQKFKEPEWWENWNFEERNFERNNPQNFDGSTTLNLQLFLQGIKSSTIDLIEAKNPVAAYLCLAIQKN